MKWEKTVIWANKSVQKLFRCGCTHQSTQSLAIEPRDVFNNNLRFRIARTEPRLVYRCGDSASERLRDLLGVLHSALMTTQTQCFLNGLGIAFWRRRPAIAGAFAMAESCSSESRWRRPQTRSHRAQSRQCLYLCCIHQPDLFMRCRFAYDTNNIMSLRISQAPQPLNWVSRVLCGGLALWAALARFWIIIYE